MSSHRFIGRKITQAALLDPPGMMFDADAAQAILIRGDDGRPPVLCEENLSGYIHNNGLHGLMGPEAARRIRETLPDASIVIFLRSQPDMIASSYAQYVRAGGTHGIERYLFPRKTLRGALAQPYKAPFFDFSHFRYLELIRHYRALFGPEHVHVFLYEQFRETPDQFIARFCARLGVVCDLRVIDFGKRYESWGETSLSFARSANRLTRRSVVDKNMIADLPGAYLLAKALAGSISKLFPRRSGQRLPASIDREIVEKFAASNAQLAVETGLPLGAFGYPMPKDPLSAVAPQAEIVPFPVSSVA